MSAGISTVARHAGFTTRSISGGTKLSSIPAAAAIEHRSPCRLDDDRPPAHERERAKQSQPQDQIVVLRGLESLAESADRVDGGPPNPDTRDVADVVGDQEPR